MENLSNKLTELGISKVRLAKYLGVSRQMIYNYLELDDLNKWPKDKKVLLLNLLGVKSAEDVANIKVNTDYIVTVEARMANFFKTSEDYLKNDKQQSLVSINSTNLSKNEQELLQNIVTFVKDLLEDKSNSNGYNTAKYLYHFMSKEHYDKILKEGGLGFSEKSDGYL